LRAVEADDPDAVIRDVGRRVAELRVGLGLTQDKFAESLGVSGVYVRRVEIGQENLTLRSLTRFATTLGVRTVDLLAAPSSREVRVGRPPHRPRTASETAPSTASVADARPDKALPGQTEPGVDSPSSATTTEPGADAGPPRQE
jgi:transcriptional regulator with XRE-family HTH domain